MTMSRNPLLPAGAAVPITGLLSRMRDDSCVIQRPATGRDNTGAPAAGFTTVATEPCRVVAPQRQPVESTGGGGFSPVVDYEVRFAPDVVIGSEDRIVVNGRTLRVIADNDAVSHGFELVVKTKAVVA